MKRTCVLTANRAEYGILEPVLRELRDTAGFQLQLVVSGAHLAPDMGLTRTDIEKDHFEISGCVEMLLSSDTAVGATKSLGVGVIGFADLLDRLAPDLVILAGDRYETLGMAQAAAIARVPVAHIHGGELTEGAIDDGVRHAITKLSHLHFVAAEPFRRRVIQLGEDPSRVHTVGAPSLDTLMRLPTPDRRELESALGLRLRSPLLLVTYHATSSEPGRTERGVEELTDALHRFRQGSIIFTKPNPDPGSRRVGTWVESYANRHPETARAFASLGQRRYLSLLRLADVVVGNSSSGLIEAPAVPTATVNVGRRQQGRLRCESVIDCEERGEEIAAAIRTALSDDFRKKLEQVRSPYGDGRAATRIVETLDAVPLEGLLEKRFHDLPAHAGESSEEGGRW